MIRTLLICGMAILSSFAFAQKPKQYSAADIQLMLEKLNVLGTALYVAAHPDDENTRLITYLANEKKLYTGYFSVTRGDGGQNLIGPEIQDQLGVIRTQELLEARRIDGGVQFFSRARDFGYSKHPDETFTIWDRDAVLSDLVWVIRKFRPDVIINRFNTKPGETHGHHTGSAILAIEAFKKAGDPKCFAEHLEYVAPWQPTSIYWNAYWWRNPEGVNLDELLSYDIGAYNPLLGKSYSEIAALSRSQHKSQGFGSSGQRGEIHDRLQFVDGKEAQNDILENIDLSWGRVEGGEAIEAEVAAIIRAFNPRQPYEAVAPLLSLRKKVEALKDEFWRQRKLREIDELVYACAGLYLEAAASEFSASHGDSIVLSIEAVNRSPVQVSLVSAKIVQLDMTLPADSVLPENKRGESKTPIVVPRHISISQPYWLVEEGTLGMFAVNDQQMIGKAQNGNALDVIFTLDIGGQKVSYKKPVVYKRNDPVKGEVYRPFVVTPPVFSRIEGGVWMFPDEKARKVKVSVKAGKDRVAGKVYLKLPPGWKSTPQSFDYAIEVKGQEQSFEFEILPPKNTSNATAMAVATLDGTEYSRQLVSLEYDHISAQTLFPLATSNFVRVELQKKGERIGYIAGAGDAVPEALEQVGYRVEMIDPKGISAHSLKKYDAVIVGVRAYNVEEKLKFATAHLHEYVKKGGTVIVQYNTIFGLVTDDIAPYPIKLSRERVTVEGSPVTFLNDKHPILNYPNKISQKDFEGWVQERGLYFPVEWDEKFEPVVAMADPGEDELKGGILVAEHGEGYFIYSSLSWFRELPAGVPGAYRLFTNMISIGK